MTLRYLLLLLMVILLLGPQTALCDDNKGAAEALLDALEDPAASNEPWDVTARKHGLSEADIFALEKNRILVTNETYKQIFKVYQSGDTPLFITSDSLLNAYHVLYEESIFRLESSLATRLSEILKWIMKNLDASDDDLKGKPELVAAAKKRAKLVTGVAVRLLDDSFRFDDDKLDKILDEETKRIVKAEGTGMPEWLGKPEGSFMAIDYSRYKPRGFYTRSEKLKRYFRAVSWLQSIPFRVAKDEELLAILILGNSTNTGDYFKKQKDIRTFFCCYYHFIGVGDDWDIISAGNEASYSMRMDLNSNDLKDERDNLIEEVKNCGDSTHISDQIRLPPDDPKAVAEPQFRFLTAYRTPSAVLFQQTTALRRFNRPFPNGLEVAAALGSAQAGEFLNSPQKAELLKTIDSCRPFFQGEDSLYLIYLNVLEALLDKPEPDAPDFMKTEAWEIKSINTVLAGWAQLRHTWALQAKQNVYYLGMNEVPEGFVEPEPEFFSRMTYLAKNTKYLLTVSGAFETDYSQVALNLRKFKKIIEGLKSIDELRKVYSRLTPEEIEDYNIMFMLMEEIPTKAKDGTEAYFKEMTKLFDTFANDIEEGRIDKHPHLKATVDGLLFDLEGLWTCLEITSCHLESIAHKQLRGVDLNKRDIAFIKEYGNKIAGIMLHGGNSYLTPKDDSPRVVDVYANPQRGKCTSFTLGKARRYCAKEPCCRTTNSTPRRD